MCLQPSSTKKKPYQMKLHTHWHTLHTHSQKTLRDEIAHTLHTAKSFTRWNCTHTHTYPPNTQPNSKETHCKRSKPKSIIKYHSPRARISHSSTVYGGGDVDKSSLVKSVLNQKGTSQPMKTTNKIVHYHRLQQVSPNSLTISLRISWT